MKLVRRLGVDAVITDHTREAIAVLRAAAEPTDAR